LLSGQKQANDDDTSITLLREVFSIFVDQDADALHSYVLATYLNATEEAPWRRWNGGKGLDACTLARILRGFDVRSRNVRVGESVRKGYMLDEVLEAVDKFKAWPQEDA